jgi:beta-lactamase regulating signal transducer with metallopeptidase domain
MSVIREVLFSLLFNAILQISLFAVVAAALSSFLKRIQARDRHHFYLGVLVLSLTAPVVNTFWHARPSVTAESTPQKLPQQEDSAGHRFWDWEGRSETRIPTELRSRGQGAVVAVWGLLVFYGVIHFGRGVRRVYRLRKEALPLEPAAQPAISAWLNSGSRRIDLLESASIEVPVTVGFFRPAIVLPRNLVPRLQERDLAAVIAHEFAHIQRRDFLIHILCEALTVPVFWHPGIRYLISRISQTRELACDEFAAGRLGRRHLYAQVLLRLASLCLHSSHADTMGLSIFDGDNLEVRIMSLTEKRSPLSRAGALGLALTASLIFASGAMVARATSLQADSARSSRTQEFAGTWHWMFQGRSFATMILIPDGSGFSGSVTESRIALDDQGYLSKADPSENAVAVPITKTVMEGTALRVTVGDGFEFLVTVKDGTHVEIHPVAAPAIMKPIQAEKVQ